MKETFTHPHARCPWCRTKLDAASDPVGDATPKPGDLSVCINCAAMLTFGDDLKLRALSAKEIAALPIDTARELVRYAMAVRTLKRDA